jgi:hypothetical protein
MMGVEVNRPCGWCMVVAGSICSQNAQDGQVALLHLGSNGQDLWYALTCVWFLCDAS